MRAKILVFILFLILGYHAVEFVNKEVNLLIQYTKSVVTKVELEIISSSIYSQLVISNGYKLPRKSNDEWRAFIQSNLMSKIVNRDVSIDFWKTPFFVKEVNHIVGKEQGGFEVRSAGPDSEFFTEDDIIALNSYL